MNILIIAGTQRIGNKTTVIANELYDQFIETDNEINLVNLSDCNLPMLEYPFQYHPSPTEEMIILKEKIDAADGVVFVTPEYNSSYPGILKNMIDYFAKEWYHKPIGIVGVSSGMHGGITAVRDLQKLMLQLRSMIVPDILLTPFVNKVAPNESVVDEEYKERIQSFIKNHLIITEKLNPELTYN